LFFIECEESGVGMLYQSPSQEQGMSLDQRLRLLYPMVNEEETPLPRAWSTKVSYRIGSTVLRILNRSESGSGENFYSINSIIFHYSLFNYSLISKVFTPARQF
jgi:hypothetical protein